MRFGSLLHWARLALGVGCVATAVELAAVHVPDAVKGMNATVRTYSYIHDPGYRIITSGDMLGLTADLQSQALALIPRRALYAVALPKDPQVASDRFGISSITYSVVEPWFRYLLLPAKPTSLEQAQYVICWGCDRAALDRRTSWLWQGQNGQAIGRLTA